MRFLGILLISLALISCDFRSSSNKDSALNKDLIKVADSISKLISEYHYNPAELATDEYLALEKEVRALARTVETKQEFIQGFNGLWADGPFSHVRLDMAERPAADMAEFIDSLRVGDHAVSLEWVEKTAILTLTTMNGIDTKERVFEAYREITAEQADNLIIDLRNNTGGTFAGVPLIGHVLTDSLDAGIFVSRKWWFNNTEAPQIGDIQNLMPWYGWSIKSFWHDVQEAPLTRVKFGPMEPHFNGPVYVLTSSKSASAAEFTVDALAHVEKATIIGETTAGAMLSQKMYDLPQGLQLSLPIAEYYSTRIGRIEGKGVKPEISIDQSTARDLAILLINGEPLKEALAMVQVQIDSMEEQPFKGESLYLFGNMNDWGKKWNITPKFEYMGKRIYSTSTTFNRGRYEFKIAPMSWDFDFGATPNQENVKIGNKISLVKVPGSSNLVIDIEEKASLAFSLDVSDPENAYLEVTEN